MGRRNCESCNEAMNDAAATCPHCGFKQSMVVKASMTREEARALLTMAAASRAPVETTSPGRFGALFLPHPRSHGAGRIAELVLTVAGLPLVAGSLLTLAFTRALRGTPSVGEGGQLVAAILAGGLGLWSILGVAKVSTAGILTTIGVSSAALIARYLIRRRYEGDVSTELARR